MSFRNVINTTYKINMSFLARNFSNRNIMALNDKEMINAIFPGNSSQDITDLCNDSPQCVYAGFDPTADSLHVGNLLVLLNLIHWQRGGHEIGGATGRIGDPSGKTKEREEQHKKTIERNIECIKANINTIFDNHKKYFWKDKDELKPVNVVDNYSWYKESSAIEFISSVGRHFRMGDLLSRSSVATRISSETGLNFCEFSYQVFQAYDWMHLLTQYNCRFQVGGSDQMGNIMSGYDLITKIYGKPVYGITLPLITTESGDKFGKSAGNAIWLTSTKTNCFDFYQFFVRTTDSQVGKLLNLLTFSTSGYIKDLMLRHNKRPEEREAQRYLADQLTLLVHGEHGLASAKKTAAIMYSSDLTQISSLSAEEVSNAFQGAPIINIMLRPGITVKQVALAAKCFLTEKDADRIIPAGGFYMNYNKAKNPDEVLVPGVHILPNNISLLRVGKKNYWIVKWLR